MDLMQPTCRLHRSLGSSSIMGCAIRISVVISMLTAVHGCSHETQERPSESATDKHTIQLKPNDAPLPDTAFSDDSSRPNYSASKSPSGAQPDRFATRSIGSEGSSSGSIRSGGHGAPPVDLDLKGADIHDVFRLLADVGKVNIVVAGEVSGTITMRLRHIPWDDVMYAIARIKNLAFEREGNVIMVRPASAK